jgi:hypothetical protein
MRARVMISSVTKDELQLGNLNRLARVWNETTGLQQRLVGDRIASTTTFSAIRSEIVTHLNGKYGFDAYIFEETPGPGRSPETETVLEATRAHLVLGIFGSKTGWTVDDQDPLTPTLREWRVALKQALKFRLFWMKGSIRPSEIPGELGVVLSELTAYKTGKVYMEFESAAELLFKIDRVVQDYLNTAVIRYAIDAVAREPSSESEKWLLSSYRSRFELMQKALARVAANLGVKHSALQLGTHGQPVSLHCVPDGFGVAEARKFVAYVFDDEPEGRKPKTLGRLSIIACFRSITDGQIRRHLGNVEASEVFPGPWGFYAADPISGRQALYLPRCDNPLRMEFCLSGAITWLLGHVAGVKKLASLRQRILDAGK